MTNRPDPTIARHRPLRNSRLFAILIWTVGWLQTPAAADGGFTPIAERPPAPQLDLVDLNGKRHRIDDYAGRVIIVNFWATWCPPCRAEMPSMQRAREALDDNAVTLLAVAVGEDAEAVEPFAAEYPVAFPLLPDADMTATSAWSVTGVPTTFVVDREGRLVYRIIGEREWDEPGILKTIENLMR